MNARACAAAAVLLVGCGGGAATATQSASPTTSAPPSPSYVVSFVPVSTPNATPSPTRATRNVVFRDPSNGNSLAIEVAASAPERGRFSFAVSGGVYGGEARASLSSLSAPMSVSFEGPLDFVTDGGTKRRTSATLRGTIDPDRHAADVTLEADGKSFAISARPAELGTLMPVLARMEAALVADDAAAFYAVLSKGSRSEYTQAQFADAWRAQEGTTGRRVTALRRVSIGAIVDADVGYASVEVRYSADITDVNGPRTIALAAYLVFEEGDWRVESTSEN